MKTLKKISYIYIWLPIICFVLFYMNTIISYIFAAVATGMLVFVLMNLRKKREKQESLITPRIVILFAVIAVVWSFLGGQGNLYYQSSDWGCRNAIYRDLIYRDWPVVYPTYNRALVYYIGYWLPAAVLTKTIGIFVPSIYQTQLAFQIGNILLWTWTSIGMTLVQLLVLTYVRPKNEKRIWLIPTALVLFSGLDIIGVLRDVIEYHGTFTYQHIEWWPLYGLQFSSITTCLFWVFNQAVIPWIVLLLLIQEKNIENYGMLGLASLISGPIPFLGIAIYLVLIAVKRCVEYLISGKGKVFISRLFSGQNLCAVCVFPVILLYYSGNNAMNMGAGGTAQSVFPVRRIVLYLF